MPPDGWAQVNSGQQLGRVKVVKVPGRSRMWLPKRRCIRQKRGAVSTSRSVTLIFAQYVQECRGTPCFGYQDIAADRVTLLRAPGRADDRAVLCL